MNDDELERRLSVIEGKLDTILVALSGQPAATSAYPSVTYPQPSYPGGAYPGFGGLTAEEQQLAYNGRKIQAIKLYRERTGTSLKQAKDDVERFSQGPIR